ncbi:MAG: radical SAM protein, partial [Candidatus Sumerlaeia bacterium]|nr:radical SAM protein [Candidatus Sumerlaeia bacterium]
YKVRSVSYTYTEPTIFFEYAYDTAKLATQEGILNNFVSNGYMTPEAIEMIKPYLQAINVDLKAFSKDVYVNYIKAKLDGVLESIRALKTAGIWVEITTLIIPGLNDDEVQLRDCAEFIASVDRAIPWHVSRYHPDYRYHSAPATPVSTLQRARRIGIESGLYYVYTGNIPGDEGENTFCYNCGKLLIQRFGFSILQKNIQDAHCPQCKTAIHGVGL